MSNGSLEQHSGLRWVLLPGLDGTGELFENFIEHLPASVARQVISYPVDQCLGYKELAVRVCQSLPESAPYILIAESFSGPVAIKVAKSCRRNLRGVVLCASFVSDPTQWYHRRLLPLIALLDWPIRLPRWIVRRYVLGRNASDEQIQIFWRTIQQVQRSVFSCRIQEIFRCDVRRCFEELPVPLLYLAGMHDRLVTQRSLSMMTAIRPDMKVSELDCSHFVLQCKPREAVDAIQEFVNLL